MTATARIYWVTDSIGRLFVWNHAAAEYGDAYYLHAIVFLIGHEVIEIAGLDKKVKRKHWQAIIQLCKRDGFRRILAKRFCKGVERDHWIEVKK